MYAHEGLNIRGIGVRDALNSSGGCGGRHDAIQIARVADGLLSRQEPRHH